MELLKSFLPFVTKQLLVTESRVPIHDMPFTKSQRSVLQAVITKEDEWKHKAQNYLVQVEKLAKKYFSFPDQEARITLLAAEAFRIAGENSLHECAKAYGHAATLYADALKDPKRAADLFTEAGAVAEKIDTDFANEYYRKAVSQHCDSSEYSAAAMLKERMAVNFEKKNDIEASIEENQRASQLHKAAQKQDDADRTLDRAAYLLGKTGRYREAAHAYQSLAIGQTQQNLKKFNVPSIMLRASLLLLHDCLIKSPSDDLEEVKEFVSSTYQLDCRFGESREQDFLSDIFQCIKHGDLGAFADRMYSFNLLQEFDDLMLLVLGGVKDVVSKRGKEQA